MLFVYAGAEWVRDSILTEVQLEKHNTKVKYDSKAWVICFPEDDPIVQIQLMRDLDRGLICVDFCRVGPDREYFLKWEEALRQRIKEEIENCD